jgi:hypothetical protein
MIADFDRYGKDENKQGLDMIKIESVKWNKVVHNCLREYVVRFSR